MRLIDADKLLHQGYDYVVDGIAYDSCNKSMDIEDIPIVQAIPLDRIKQAKEEIDKLDTKIAIRDTPQGRESYFIVDQAEALKILDKLIAESEE